jgi:Tfp pilus assembly protein PilF
MTARWHALAACGVALMLSGCMTPSVTQLLSQPAERALLAGIRAYDDAQYAAAERELQAALQAKLGDARDRATAHKLLAFIQCTSERTALCEQSFRAARSADANFALSKAESGHPVWGPVYQRIAADGAPVAR